MMSAPSIMGVELSRDEQTGLYETGIIAERFSVTIEESACGDETVTTVHVLNADGSGRFPIRVDWCGPSVSAAAEDAEDVIETLIAIGCARGLRKAAGICSARSAEIDTPFTSKTVEELETIAGRITAAADDIEKGGGG